MLTTARRACLIENALAPPKKAAFAFLLLLLREHLISAAEIGLLQVSDRGPIFQPANLEADRIEAWSSFNMYLYAERHSYVYIHVAANKTRDRRGSWNKVYWARKLLHRFDYLVICDFDVMFVDVERRIEDLMDHWGWTPKARGLASLDPDVPRNHITWQNGSKIVAANTGFIILRNDPKVKRMLQDWWDCPVVIPGCEKWLKRQGGHLYTDQGAWNEFVRMRFTQQELILVHCNQANGHPKSLLCNGEHVKHFWTDKSGMIKCLHKSILKGIIDQPL